MKRSIAALCLGLAAMAASAIELQGDLRAHDPGAIIKDGDTYFNFTTGRRIWYTQSKDLLNWGMGTKFEVFGWDLPAWVLQKKPDFDTDPKNAGFWAPEAFYMNGYYYIYYSVSTFQTSNSAIGVARSPSLRNPVWTDLGKVVESFGGLAEINAIDPALFRDHNGKVYMSYGSFYGGIGLVEINQSTGKAAGNVTRIWGGGHADIEAPYITRDGKYYYLFVNRGVCCDGGNSTYYVQVQRAESITGPYTETRVVLPNLSGKYKGPGHIGVLKQDGCHFVSTHYYDASASYAAKLDIQRMTYSNGWPVMTRNFTSFAGCGGISDGAYAIRSRLSGKVLSVAGSSTDNGAMVQQRSDAGAPAQSWYVIGHGGGTGKYSIINVHSLRSLDNYGNSTQPGTPIAQWDYWNGPGQRWSFASPAAGYQTIANELSGHVLDVLNRSLEENVQIIQWTRTNASNQQWSLQRR